MITFLNFNSMVKIQFSHMQRVGKLYRTDVTGDQIWDAYINGFTAEQNPVFRHPESTYHNCNHDRNFIRRYGNVVAIDDQTNEIVHLFDFDAPEPYSDAVNAVKDLFKAAKVVNVFVETFDVLNAMPYSKIKKTDNLFQLGHERTLKVYTPEEAAVYGMVTAGKTYEFNHFHVMLNRENLYFSDKSPESIMGEKRAAAEVFQRLMEEVGVDTINLVIDLIEQDSVLNSEQQIGKLKKIAELRVEYGKLSENQKTNFCWKVAESLPYAKLRNESIGTLLVNLSQGMEINDAIQTYNRLVDPANYMRAKSPITEKMKMEAQNFIEEKGYLEAFNRRFAVISDINISEVYHKNVDGKAKNAGLFADVPTKKTAHRKAEIDGVVEIGIEKFMSDVLPKATKIEVLVENKHAENFVALHTSDAEKGIFKWNNNFGWTYINGLTGVSTIKEEVKKAGGVVDAPFRFSIIWNENGGDIVDLDAHANEPDGTHIYFRSSFRKDRGNGKTSMGGQLDVDMVNPTTVGVENIYWESMKKLGNGKYQFKVNNFNNRNHNGFRAELYLNGETYTYVYEGKLTDTVTVATVEFKNGEFVNVQGHLKEDKTSREVWGVNVNDFHTVKLVSLSPNYWGENKFDTKHYFFMLDNCKPDAPLASFHNQFLVGELLEFRKPLQILSDIRKIKPSEKCLAGLGFNATMRNSLVVKVVGTHTRFMKINF